MFLSHLANRLAHHTIIATRKADKAATAKITSLEEKHTDAEGNIVLSTISKPKAITSFMDTCKAAYNKEI